MSAMSDVYTEAQERGAAEGWPVTITRNGHDLTLWACCVSDMGPPCPHQVSAVRP